MVTKSAYNHPFTPSEHLDKAQRNENLACALFNLGVPCCDWIITIIFYSALHYCYSKLPVQYVQPTHSDLINEITKKYSHNLMLYQSFKSLKDKSEDGRYFPHLAKKQKEDRKFCKERFEELEKIKKELKI